MPIYIKDGKSIHFVHIPKSAGTSIQQLFVDNNYSVYLFNKKNMFDFPCCPQHFHNELNDYLNILDCYYSFTIVRDPLSRILSEYRFRGMPEKNISFDVFVRAAFMLYKLNKYCFDNHIRPQHEFISDGIKVYKYEDGVNSILLSLEAKGIVKIPEIIPHKYKSKSEQLCLTSDTLKRVYDFYDKDYNLFNYDKNTKSAFVDIDDPYYSFTGLKAVLLCAKIHFMTTVKSIIKKYSFLRK
ncbi:sulfotransferase family 2 domain-containing protein [Cobetia sp. 1CM21F]|uniref:sulfotransferase family 2 domain-containing protein n=1 Tax=Cobetia sp. 1CM21F TaxID=2929163 RepID=UPI0020BFBC6C|nr:sulfotransferase family 2 domain-containing protein [Cobetia sp. 1CM21F]MCK8066921.1 sulfotransferase family protein [Cobetia sp. 1CM21F]